MEFDKTDSQGSFSARGAGFFYRYRNRRNFLDIMDGAQSKSFGHFEFESCPCENARHYIRCLDRANQIRALIYSNNKTVNLFETLDARKIGAILNSTTRSSYYAHRLSTSSFAYFTSTFAKETNLKKFKIKKFISNNRVNEFFVGRIHTFNNNSISARSFTLSGLLSTLSQQTMCDLATLEYTCKNSSHNLMNVSSRLAFLSNILNDNLAPQNMIESEDKNSDRNYC